jgi:nucleoside-diphosphate-sugar epimerase
MGDMNERVFITGATGYVGSAVAARLVRAGYEVYGLTRNAERAAGLTLLGVHPVVGELSRLESYLPAVKNCDIVVHTAFDPAETANLDRVALEAVRTGALDGRVRRLIYTSGTWVHGDTGGVMVDESAPLHPVELVRWRAAHEDVALDLGEQEIAVIVLRPGTVYGESRGEMGRWFAAGHEKKVVRYPGSAQHWTMVHRDDLAEAYLRAIERGTGGSRYNVNDGSSPTVRELAEAVARVTGATAQPWDLDEFVKRFGLYGKAQFTSQKLSPARAQSELGWTPRHRSFVDEVEALDHEWQETRNTPVR